jgi:hypothetical protein
MNSCVYRATNQLVVFATEFLIPYVLFYIPSVYII